MFASMAVNAPRRACKHVCETPSVAMKVTMGVMKRWDAHTHHYKMYSGGMADETDGRWMHEVGDEMNWG